MSDGAARARILERVRKALGDRCPHHHPGSLGPWREAPPDFAAMFTAAGGEVLRFPSREAAREWLNGFLQGRTASVGRTVPRELRPDAGAASRKESEAGPASEKRPDAGLTSHDRAEVGVSMARCAVAETGSLLLEARDGRRTQLLPPVHVVFVPEEDVVETLAEALARTDPDGESAAALHSGPSKSADIGQILVRGVHGPGRLIAAIIDS
ncbi:MAG: lactate utilization protein C [Gemmatimonadota bacterium]